MKMNLNKGEDEMDNNIIEVEIIPKRELFYSHDSNFGIYGCVTKTPDERIRLNEFGNFTIKGNMIKLNIDMEYKAQLEEVNDKKYGLGYQVKSIKQDKPKTIQEQHAYIRTLLREDHANLIIEKYPDRDLLEMFKNDEIDYSDLKGIGEKTYQKIKYFLLNHLDIQDALVKLAPLGVTFKMLHKMIEHYGDVQILMSKIEENIYLLTKINGIGFKKIDQYALASGLQKEDEKRIHAGIVYTLEQEENMGHSYLEIDTLIKKAEGILKIKYKDIQLYIAKLQDEDNEDFYITEDIIAIRDNYKCEKRIKELLFRLIDSDNKFHVTNPENKIKAIEDEQGFEFTDEQRNAIYTAIKSNVMVISGKAGSGKSALLKGILGVLDNYTYETCALSGKAAMRIVESGLKSSTIHRLLGFKPNGGFEYNENNKLPTDIIVLDEAGMVGAKMFYLLIRAIERGTKFIIVGDVAQLESIGFGNVFKDIIESGIVPLIELTKVHRQAMKSGILSCANEIREGKQINKAENYQRQVYGELKDFHLIPLQTGEYVVENILNICKRYKGDILDLQIVVPMKSRGDLSANNLNKQLQEIFNPNQSKFLKRGEKIIKLNDKVIHNGNNYETGVFNGQIGIVEDIVTVEDEKCLQINFKETNTTVFYSTSDFDKIDLAYAITCHRSQGSGWKNVIVGLNYSAYMMLNKQWCYTALTRASKYCVMVAENRALRHAIRTNNSNKRNTFLLSMLKDENFR